MGKIVCQPFLIGTFTSKLFNNCPLQIENEKNMGDFACIDLMNTLALQEMLQGLLHCNDGNHRIRLPNKLNIKVFKF